jgi:predicted porin
VNWRGEYIEELGMTGGFKMSAGTLSLLAAMGVLLVGGTSAQAADLGGNCCADLEERIAELETTTARKGNRKVSLEIYGHINQAIMFWDDGFEDNAYIVTNDNARSRFGFKGSAKIADGWKAGYNMEIGVRTANSKRAYQDDPIFDGNSANIGLDVRHAYWYIDSKKLGRVSLGVTGSAAEGVTEINLAATKDVAKFSDVEDSGLGMRLRTTTGGFASTAWRKLIGENGDQPGEGDRREQVKYDTPEIAGFTGTAAWGTDDFWDIGLRYKGEWGDFKVAAGFAYGENTDAGGSTSINFGCATNGAVNDADCSQYGGSASVMHEPTGLYVNVAAGLLEDNTINSLAGFENAENESTFWAVEAGIEKKWIPLGKTTIFGQYYDYDGGANGISTFSVPGEFTSDPILSTGIQMYGVGVVQGIDAAAMHLYAYYRHYEADLTVNTGTPAAVTPTAVDLEDLDIVMGGAIIKF